MKSRTFLFALIISICLITLASCSGGPLPVAPSEPEPALVTNAGTHSTWGLWQFIADPEDETLEVIQLRTGYFHLNALPFLEPPPFALLSVESYEFNGNIIDADIGLRHPFLGLIEFTGFDVTGIFITNGSYSGFEDTDITIAGDGDTRLLNPDGLTRWWNPAEFPSDGTVFGYNDGLLGTSDEYGDFNCTLNGYKFFCDDLADPDTPLDDLDPASRCVFSAGQKNVRHYTIELGSEGFIFNYAIDACWEFPIDSPPWTVPDSFSENANRPEAWNITVTELDNTLWNDGVGNGGDLSLLIDVWDHYNADLNTVKIESAGNFISGSSSSAIGGGIGYSTYQLDITDATPCPDSMEILVTVASEQENYQDFLPGKTTSAYFLIDVPVDDEAPQQQGPGKIAWVSARDGNPEIYRMQGDGTLQTRLTNYSSHDWDPAWSPDGSEIAWRRGGYDAANIWIMNEDGSNQHQATTDGWNFDPDWDPLGEWLYFWSYDGSGGASPRIWKVRPDGTGQQQVSSISVPAVNHFVSPDGLFIAFEGGSTSGARDLWIMGIDGTNPVQLSNTTYWEAYPTYNSDGTKICFGSNPVVGDFKLFFINPDGSGYEQATYPPAGNSDDMGCFGVNDEELVIWRRMGPSNSNDEIGIYDLATDGFTQLTIGGSYDEYPDWHPDD